MDVLKVSNIQWLCKCSKSQPLTIHSPQRLSGFLDRPFFPWKKLIVSFSLGQFLLDSFLSYRQYRVLCATRIPKALESEIDQKTYDKSQAYGRAKAKFGLVNSLISQALDFAIIYYDVYPRLWQITGSWLLTYFPTRFTGEISHSLLFIFTYGLATSLLDLPFSYYKNFILEESFGFNKQTLRIWISDFFKTQGLSLALGLPIGSAFLAIIQKTGDAFFLYLWLFAMTMQMFLLTVFPILIVPLFNKLTPLPPGSLKSSIDTLADSLKFPLSELQVIDGSKRSAHSNAYFTGLPWKKTIVLFDTLIEKSSESEVVAVLAHELGHWKMGHIMKNMGIVQCHLFFVFALFAAFVRNASLYFSFGFGPAAGFGINTRPIIIGFILFNEIFAPVESLVSLGMNVLSRKFEFEADAFSAQLGHSKELARSLIKLQIQNLSAMDADWMYSAYHHSHPILTERLRALGYKGGEKVTDGAAKTSNGDLRKEDGVAVASGREL